MAAKKDTAKTRVPSSPLDVGLDPEILTAAYGGDVAAQAETLAHRFAALARTLHSTTRDVHKEIVAVTWGTYEALRRRGRSETARRKTLLAFFYTLAANSRGIGGFHHHPRGLHLEEAELAAIYTALRNTTGGAPTSGSGRRGKYGLLVPIFKRLGFAVTSNQLRKDLIEVRRACALADEESKAWGIRWRAGANEITGPIADGTDSRQGGNWRDSEDVAIGTYHRPHRPAARTRRPSPGSRR